MRAKDHEAVPLDAPGFVSPGKTPLEEQWHFALKKKPYPDTCFDFPVSSNSLKQQKKNDHKSPAEEKI